MSDSYPYPRDNMSEDTVTYTVGEYNTLRDRMLKAERLLADTEAERVLLPSMTDLARTVLRNRESQINAFEAELREAVTEGTIDSDLAVTFAEIFDLELSKTYNVTITGSWSGTVTVPLGLDIDDLDSEIICEYPTAGYSDFELDINENSLESEWTDR